MKKLTKILTLICAFAAMVSLFAFPAFASGNTGNTYLNNFKATVIGYHEMDDSDARQKYNYTATYLYLTSGTHDTARVKVLGATARDESYKNQTYYNGSYVDYVTCSVGTSYEVHNMAKENGRSWVKLSFRSPYTTANYLDGAWSPDCGGSYTDATP